MTEATFKMIHIVVTETNRADRRLQGAFDKAGMQVVVAYEYVTLRSQGRENSVVRLKAGAKDERVLFAGKRGEFALESDVQVERSIQDSCATATRAISA
jgi:hypothetical protein